jgi:hypothetical protein
MYELFNDDPTWPNKFGRDGGVVGPVVDWLVTDPWNDHY